MWNAAHNAKVTIKVLKIVMVACMVLAFAYVVFSSEGPPLHILTKSTLRPTNPGVANVEKINGLEVYILSEPDRPYRVVNNALGLGFPPVDREQIRKYVERYVKRASKAGQDIDAIIYKTGNKAMAVKFK